MNSRLSKGFFDGLERSEKKFQAKMRSIYEKYDHAFEDDIVVNIIDFTYNAPEGPIPWDFKTRTTGERKHEKRKTPEREQHSAFIQVSATEDRSGEILEEALNTTCLLPKTSDDIFNRTFIIDTPVSMKIKSFIRRQNKDCSFGDTRNNDFQADESSLQCSKETTYCNSGDSNLSDRYPDMVECIGRLLELPWKKHAADHIRQYYKQHVWNAYKKLPIKQILHRPSNFSKMHTHPLKDYEPIKGCSRYQECPVLQSSVMENKATTSRKSFIKQAQMESFKTDSFYIKKQNRHISMCKTETHDVDSSFQETVKWFPKGTGTPIRTSPEKHSIMLKRNVDLHNASLDNAFIHQNSLKDSFISNIKEQDKPLPGSSFSAFPVLKSPRKHTVTLSSSMESKATNSYISFIKQNQVKSYKTDSSYIKEQKRQTFMHKNRPETHDVNSSFLENIKWIPMVAGTLNGTSPGKHSDMLKCSVHPSNTSLESSFSCQKSVDINEVKSFDRKGQDEHPSRNYSMIKRNSLSVLPLIHSPKSNNKSFFSLNNTTLSLDKTVSYQGDSKTLERTVSCNQELNRQFFKLEDPRAKYSSFSTLPVVNSLVREKKIPDVMFEPKYRVENRNGSLPNVRVQSSEMVWSLVNSPESRRSKRQASTNVCFSALKRQRSADETFIQSNTAHRSMDSNSLFWPESTDSSPNTNPEAKLQVKSNNTG